MQESMSCWNQQDEGPCATIPNEGGIENIYAAPGWQSWGNGYLSLSPGKKGHLEEMGRFLRSSWLEYVSP